MKRRVKRCVKRRVKGRVKNSSDGYIVAETAGVFIPFVLLIASILSLVNIITVQTRVHYALTQAANTLSMYCYALDAAGVSDKLIKLGEESGKVKAEIDGLKADILGVITGVEKLSQAHGADKEISAPSGEYTAEETFAGEPMNLLQQIINYGLGESVETLFETLVRPLIGRYLSNGSMTGDAYLKAFNVENGLNSLKFYEFDLFDIHSIGHRNSTLINQNGDVVLVVQYEIEYKFGTLPLPFKPVLKVTQTAVTKAWLGGYGKGYW